jgi:hypothetical protein
MDISRYNQIIGGLFSIAVIVVGYILATQPINPLVNEPPTIGPLMANFPSPQPEGTPITWTAIASDPDQDTLFYKFQLCGPSTENRYVDQQNWSQNREWIWNSTHANIGLNFIRVFVKDSEHEEQSPSEPYNITRSEFGEIIHSEYAKMNQSETYAFVACIALSDSIETAKSDIKNFTHASDESHIISNDSTEVAKIESETSPTIKKTPINISKDMMGANLSPLKHGTFLVSLIIPKTETQRIPKNDPKHNYATWIWDVTPTIVGTNDLILSVYDAEGHHREANIPITVIPITVTVTPAVEETAAEAEAKANETAEAAKKEAPGFESVFAVTGLLAVAYLVLGRRE